MRMPGCGTNRWRWLPAALLACVAAWPATARAGCVWSDVVKDAARAAAIAPGTARQFFVQDDVLARGCPNDRPSCRSRAYLTSGDIVLTAHTQGAYTCAGFVNTRGTTTIDWLPTASLVPLPAAEQTPEDWAGSWIAPEQNITIAPGPNGAFTVRGNATWGAGDPERLRRGGVNTGEVQGTARPDAGVLAFAMGDDDRTLPYDAADEFTCRLRMIRRGPYLLVRDNNACGGVNVSFSGFYRRKG